MRIVFILVLLAGLGLAGFAVSQVMKQFQGYQNRIAQLEGARVAPIETITIIVAATEIRFGHQLTATDVVEVTWPKQNAPANAFNDIAVLFGPEGSAPRSVTRVMEPGEPILVTKVTNIGEPADLRSLLTVGMRAFVINIDATSGVAGFLQPGDQVDVLWTGTGISGQTESRVLGQDIKVIAVDQSADQDVSRPQLARTATLEVSQDTVLKLVQAQNTGRLTLSLRGLTDTTIVEIGTVVDQTVIIGEREAAPDEEVICTRTVRRGVAIEEVVIPCENLDEIAPN